MTPDTKFGSTFFNPFFSKESLADNEHNPDVNFYQDFSLLDTRYLTPDKFKTSFKDYSKNSCSVFYLNIRSIYKNFQSFSELHLNVNHIISVICFSET